MTKLLAPTGFARLSSHKDAARFAARKAAEGCKVNIRQESDGKYRVVYEPAEDFDDRETVIARSLRNRPL